ncbi:DUF3644 domain-containing protein [Lentilactobacillus buchneri]|uniref:Uncharacterized protein n=1 Tax=Lentilactobacillus buchneri subsp. silagei CD034 TaxID=1071400 RepID=J9VXG3_LENBU|nr:DUF3644 domain-containing protein [Lentilactobacillus buchneri]MCC6100652.1 DUF3644 domain-containing protein [Lactobacillus sp.]AFR99157.1 hypothetical protein LBUCD034_0044 [Lentilactobacillus buchneri subsp. silagei CD034]BEJ52689.1 hypothetical protein Ltb232_08650 [Lentilactobacillus buchneri subsp. silagei]GED91125.1 hypothetical protein LBSG162_02300 [Lentilactobacillus buchneri subsp. silagei]GED94126.1 hypothetical protein LBSP_06860 [Lentilactobacillus buchneri subsp. silagei]
MNAKDNKTFLTLLEKSQEAFTLGLELYNRPTVKYRVEGFSFYICNAWELLLKSYLIKSADSLEAIFYSTKATKRSQSYSISECIKKVFTDKREPLRRNLEKIVSLRNTSIHFVTEEYEQMYAPLFQACVINYVNKLNDFFHIDITERLDQHFLSLSVNIDSLDSKAIKKKYPTSIAEQILRDQMELNEETIHTESTHFGIPINHNIYITKNKKNADFIVSVAKDSETKAAIINKLQDPKNTHPFSYSEVVNQINKWISRKKINFQVTISHGIRVAFNKSDLDLFIKFYEIKTNIDYAYKHVLGNNNQYTYSQKAINLIEKEIKDNPQRIISILKSEIKKR